MRVPAMYDSGDRSKIRRISTSNQSWGFTGDRGKAGLKPAPPNGGILLRGRKAAEGNRLTTGGRDTTPQRNQWGDVLPQESTHLLNQLPPNTRVSADERVHTDEDGTAHPCFWHAGRLEWVSQRQSRERRISLGWQHSSLLVLEESMTEGQWVVGTGVGYDRVQ